MKKKDIKEYQNLYGNIPKDFYDRFIHLISSLKLNKSSISLLRDKINSYFNIKWISVGYIIYFVPKASPRPRLSGGGRFKHFYVADAKSNNDTFGKFCKESGVDTFITTPCKITIKTYDKMPKLSKVDTILAELGIIRPISRPDWDNLAKTYSDMIQSNILLDDSLIIDGRQMKYYSIKPRIEIYIEYMNRYDSAYTKRKIKSWTTYEENENKIIDRDFI